MANPSERRARRFRSQRGGQTPPQIDEGRYDITERTGTERTCNKTELMVVAPKALLRKVGDLHLDVDGCSFSPSSEVRNLGVILDPTLSFQSHIRSITKSAFFHLKNISRLGNHSLTLWQKPSSTLSSPPVWTTAMEFCPGFPAKPWTGSSMCKTRLPGFSPAPSPGSTSPPPSSTSTGSRSSPASPTKSSSSPTNPSTPWLLSTYLTSSTLTHSPGTLDPQARVSSPSLTQDCELYHRAPQRTISGHLQKTTQDLPLHQGLWPLATAMFHCCVYLRLC
ncbi:uncharacterized protein LOC141775842 [Sebastes fasciatus]|uniref:uncharacterized protein LOC141775842 n=1 Tax=Sebastes fasciatus TaxID=394691 RepID=UPI003D9E8E81